MAYETRTVNGSVYNIPVGLRSDWQPGQSYNLPTQTVQPTTTKTPSAPAPALSPSIGQATTPEWQTFLQNAPSNPQGALAEIARAGQVWTQKNTAGDMAGAQGASNWANQIRDVLGISPFFDRQTGAAKAPMEQVLQFLGIGQAPQKELPPAIPEMDQLQALIAQLMTSQDMGMPDIDKLYQQSLGTKQNLINQRQSQTRTEFDTKTLPNLRSQLEASGFLNSDARFQQENEARSMLDRTLASIEAEMMADAYQEALQRAGYEADVAKTIADQTYRNKSLALQALNSSDEMKYRQNMIGIEQGRLGNETLKTNKDYGTGGFREQELGLQGRGLDIEQAGQNLQKAISLLSSVGVVDENLSKTLAGLGLPNIPAGTKTSDMRIAEMNAALQRELASLRGTGGSGGSGSQGSGDMVGQLSQTGASLLNDISKTKTRKEAEQTLSFYLSTITASDRAHIQAAIESRWPTAQGGKGKTLTDSFNSAYTTITGVQPNAPTQKQPYQASIVSPIDYIMNLFK